MTQTTLPRTFRSNQTTEVFRLIASLMVIFIHIPFPDTFGSAMNCLARFAVPGFFAVSGFFCYGASGEKLAKRIRNLLKLSVIAIILEALYDCVVTELAGGSTIGYLRSLIPNAESIAYCIILNAIPMRDTFWYLAAALEAMVALWLYVRFQESEGEVNYRSFYTIGFLLIVGNFTMGIMGNGAGNPGSILQYRNGLFFGIPMFAMGLFLGQYWQRIVDNFALTNLKLVVMVILCMRLSLAEWFGFGICDLMVGSVAAVLFMLLLMAKNPVISDRPGIRKLVGTFGTLSTAIYVLHPIVIDMYNDFLKQYIVEVPEEPWLRPLIVMVITLPCAMIWVGVSSLWKRIRK